MTTQKSSAFAATLMTATPEEGFALAITLSRLAVKAMQPSMDKLKNLRPEYANNANNLIAVSHVVAVHYSTIALANQYWTKSGETP